MRHNGGTICSATWRPPFHDTLYELSADYPSPGVFALIRRRFRSIPDTKRTPCDMKARRSSLRAREYRRRSVDK